MPIIPTSTTQKLLDRAGAQYAIAKLALNTDMLPSTNFFFNRVASPGDPDVTLYLTDEAEDLDLGFDVNKVMNQVTELNTLVSQLEQHVKAMGYANIDAYLYGVSLQLAQSTGDFIKATGRTLQARNVFKGTQQTLASFVVTPPVVFTPGSDLQVSSQSPYQDGNYAGVPAEITVVSGAGTVSGSLSIVAKIQAASGAPTNSTIVVSVSNGAQDAVVATIPGNVVGIVSVTYVSGITAGASFVIKNTIPRVPSL